jgi:hypothetical protein
MRAATSTGSLFGSVIAVLAITCSAAWAQPASDDQSDGHSISGRLTDANGQPRNVTGAVVFITDAETGYPLLATNHKLPGQENGLTGPDGWLHAITNSEGQFSFSGIAPGAYRLAAQSWLGLSAAQSRTDPDAILLLHGHSDIITVTETDVTGVSIKSLGTGVLSIQAVPDEGNAYLFVSTSPALAEPIVGPMFWGEDFTRNIAGVTHIKRGRQVIQGLPVGQDVHVMLLNYDNNPGMGGVSVHMEPFTNATLPIYATWSNGYHQPPERLRKLVEWLRAHKQDVDELLTDGKPDELLTSRGSRDYERFRVWVSEHGDELRRVPGVGEFPVLDIVAAENYLRVLESHEARKKRLDKK